MEYDYNKLDTAVAEVVAYFRDMCIPNGEIVLLDFNRHSLSHLAILNAAFIASKFYDLKLYIDCKLWDYWKLKRKYGKNSQFYWYTSQINGIFCEPLVYKVEQKMDQVGILKEAYEAYYDK